MTVTLRFTVEVSAEVDEEPGPNEMSRLADQLHNHLCDLDEDVLPPWLFSFDGVDPS